MLKLSRLLLNVEVIKNYCCEDYEINELCNNANKLKNNNLYFCYDGIKHNGYELLKLAKEKNAVIVCEKEIADYDKVIVVKNCRKAMAIISKHFYNDCCDKLKIVMVTGTNGKTSVTYILKSIFEQAHINCAIIGTNGIFYGNKQLYYGLTTPDPIDLHYHFQQLYNLGVEIVFMEASAHAICLNKLEGIKGEIAIFTNITNEHLDFFKTMNEYSQTKLNFVNSDNFKLRVANIDDDYSKDITNINTIFYGLNNPAHTFAVKISNNIKGLKFFINVMDDVFEIKSSLIGMFNVYNLMASITTAYLLGISITDIKKGIANLGYVPGRFNVYNVEHNNMVIIDFAHTPDGFEKILSEIKSFRKGKIITLFGCVGYSDSLKRTLMGKIASKYSDELIITSDNPNFVNFNDIALDIIKEVVVPYDLIEDRFSAIEFGFSKLNKNDTLVLLGKGCETFNLINGKKIEHNDLSAIEKILEEKYETKKVEG